MRCPLKAREAKEETKQQKDFSIEKDEATALIKSMGLPKKIFKDPIPHIVLALPFPSPFSETKKEEHEKEIMDTFQRIQVNIPLLDAIKQVPRYTKFVKELCINKRKLKGDEKVSVEENVSAVLQRILPPKCKDLGTFTILCIIGNTHFERAVLDLGASINVISYSIYASLNLG